MPSKLDNILNNQLNSTYIIAEIGINHNGSLDTALELIHKAYEARVDAVKFQKRDIDIVYSKELLNSARTSPWGETQRDQKKGLEFGSKEYDEIDKYCKEKGILWFASAWDTKSQIFLRKFKTKFNKIASAMIVHDKLLRLVAEEGKHTFISTGMSEESDIENAVRIFQEKNCPFELMHCVSTYPMKDEDANLNVIHSLKKRFECSVGYSGHESGLAVSYAAVGYEISSLESFYL